MTFWQINGCIGVINLVLFYLITQRVKHQFLQRYPDATLKRGHWATNVSFAIKLTLFSFCPIANLLMLYIVLVRDGDLCERSIEKLYTQYMDDKNRKENENV